MPKTSMGQVLKALCEEVPVSEKYNRPIKYANFRSAMLTSELFTTRESIKMRWDQLYNSITLLSERGTIKGTKQQYIVLDFNSVKIVCLRDNVVIEDYTCDKDANKNERACTCREACREGTETHTEGGSQ